MKKYQTGCLSKNFIKFFVPRRTTIEVAGGLGNQLFCYFAGYYFSKKLNTKLVIDLLYASKAHSKRFDITSFALDGQFVNKEKEFLKEAKKLGWRISDSLAHRFPTVGIIRKKYFHVYVENPGSPVDPSVYREFHSQQRIKGFFTTGKYLEILQGEDQFKTLELRNPSIWFKDMQAKSETLGGGVISVHIRRGDFLEQKETYGVLSELYYQNAIIAAREKHPESPIWVFTNDTDVVQSWNLFKKYPAEFIVRKLTSTDDYDDPAEHLKLMTLARVNIVANSSFSLFGAMLNPNSSLIICPDSVAKSSAYIVENFYPDHWMPVKAEWE